MSTEHHLRALFLTSFISQERHPVTLDLTPFITPVPEFSPIAHPHTIVYQGIFRDESTSSSTLVSKNIPSSDPFNNRCFRSLLNTSAHLVLHQMAGVELTPKHDEKPLFGCDSNTRILWSFSVQISSLNLIFLLEWYHVG